MLRGFTTVNYWADDIEAARDWYARILEIEPYFQRPEEGPPPTSSSESGLTRMSLV